MMPPPPHPLLLFFKKKRVGIASLHLCSVIFSYIYIYTHTHYSASSSSSFHFYRLHFILSKKMKYTHTHTHIYIYIRILLGKVILCSRVFEEFVSGNVYTQEQLFIEKERIFKLYREATWSRSASDNTVIFPLISTNLFFS